MKSAKFLRALCFTEHLQWMLLKVSGFQPATLLIKGLRERCFAVNFPKFLRKSFLLTEHLPLEDCFLYLSVNFKDVFQNTYFIEQ